MKLTKLITIIAVLFVTIGVTGAVLAGYRGGDGEEEKVDICHETGSENRPWRKVKVDKDAWDEHDSAHSGHENDFLIDKDHPCPPEESPTPSPEPSVEPSPEATTEAKINEPSGNVTTPQCPDGNTTNVVANPHVLRAGSDATVNFFITEGDNASIFYSVVGQPHWQHAVADIKPNADKFVSYTIHDLDPNLGYDFGIQQRQGCGGGKTTAVVVDGSATQLFKLSYWE